MSDFSAQKLAVLGGTLLLWSYAFTCSNSANLFIRVFESNVVNVSLMAALIHLISEKW